MSCAAVFIDAGYLFAQGSTALTGSKKPRSDLRLNETAVVAELVDVAQAKSAVQRILRIYWYDAAFQTRGMSLEHSALAHTDHIKLRLGHMNSQGEQKGVDSLIVTDMIELARNHAISDALLLSGDEDVRIGVQIAQSFGVRVHLLGITPCRGSQSIQLMQESDTTTEWDAKTVGKFLSYKPPASTPISPIATGAASNTISALSALQSSLDQMANDFWATLDSTDKTNLATYRQTSEASLPS